MSCFIIIGAGKSQIPFIKASKDMGYYTVAFDQNPLSQGAKIADKFFAISTHDFDAISKTCRTLSKKETIKGILTYSAFPKPLLAAAKLCQKYNLPSFSVDAMMLATNKKAMKNKFNEFGIPTPESIVVNDIHSATKFISEQSPPLIVKPCSGSQGSLGVSIVDDIQDIDFFFRSFENFR